MTRRQGVTLMEVLVAIMITGIGLLALLTLFPLGALEMVQSVKDDRCGHVKHNAASIINMLDTRLDVYIRDNGMLNPAGILPPATLNPPLPAMNNPADPNYLSYQESVSYPVIIDANGWAANQGNPAWQNWIGGQVGLAPRRMTLKELDPARSPDPVFTGAAPLPIGVASLAQYQKMQRYRYSVLLDDIYFHRDQEDYMGQACPPIAVGGGVVDRNSNWSWAYMLQMPRVRLPSVVDLTVIVYNNRPLDEAQAGENVFTAKYDPVAKIITLQWPQGTDPPDVSIGSWIMDPGMAPNPRGDFYRVVDVTQNGANAAGMNSMDVEVLTPPKRSGLAVAIVMSNVVEVFKRGDF
jgi:prepilin-type N-terminal cleavage/methylation domain-containing protein